MRYFLFLLLFFYSLTANACSVCGGEYTPGEVMAYKGTTLGLVILVVGMLIYSFRWVLKNYMNSQ